MKEDTMKVAAKLQGMKNERGRYPPPPPISKARPWLLFAGVVAITVVLVHWRAHDKPHDRQETPIPSIAAAAENSFQR